jgi:hypothetical protein
LRSIDAHKKPVKLFDEEELKNFREGRRAAREGFIAPLDLAIQDPFFARGYNQERLLVQSEQGKIILVRGLATICARCNEMNLYERPGCPCWDSDEVNLLKDWMKTGLPPHHGIEKLLKQYHLTYGVFIHLPRIAKFGFVEMDTYLKGRKEIGLPAITFPHGEPFFL